MIKNTILALAAAALLAGAAVPAVAATAPVAASSLVPTSESDYESNFGDTGGLQRRYETDAETTTSAPADVRRPLVQRENRDTQNRLDADEAAPTSLNEDDIG